MSYKVYKVKAKTNVTVHNTLTNQLFVIPQGSIGTLQTITPVVSQQGMSYRSLAKGVFNGNVINFTYYSDPYNNHDISIAFVNKAGGGGDAVFENLSNIKNISDVKPNKFSNVDGDVVKKEKYVKSSSYVIGVSLAALGTTAATCLISNSSSSKLSNNKIFAISAIAGLVYGLTAYTLTRFSSEEFEVK